MRLAALACAVGVLAGQAQALTNPVIVRCSPQFAPRGFAVQGVYVVSNSANGSVSQLGPQLNSPLVNGVFLKVQWDKVEHVQGVYDFSSVDADVATLKAAGKTYILDVYGTGLTGLTNSVTGKVTQTDTPQWLWTAGVAHLDTLDYRTDANCGNPIRLALPWDGTYQTIYTDLVSHMAAHFAGDPAFKGVAVNGFNVVTGEAGFTVTNNNTQVTCGSGQVIGPTNLTAQWLGAGYTVASALSAITFMFNTYKTYFSTTEIIYMFLAGGMPDIDSTGATNEACIYLDISAPCGASGATAGFVPIEESTLGTQGSLQYNGFKLNNADGTTSQAGVSAVFAHAALGYPAGFQAGGPISIDSTDCQGATCQSSLQCTQNGGLGKGVPPGCDGWQVLQMSQDELLNNGATSGSNARVDYFQPVGTTDIVTWNPTVTDPLWRKFNVGCNQGSLLP